MYKCKCCGEQFVFKNHYEVHETACKVNAASLFMQFNESVMPPPIPVPEEQLPLFNEGQRQLQGVAAIYSSIMGSDISLVDEWDDLRDALHL